MDFELFDTRLIRSQVLFDNDIGDCFRFPVFHISERDGASALFGYNVYWYK